MLFRIKHGEWLIWKTVRYCRVSADVWISEGSWRSRVQWNSRFEAFKNLKRWRIRCQIGQVLSIRWFIWRSSCQRKCKRWLNGLNNTLWHIVSCWLYRIVYIFVGLLAIMALQHWPFGLIPLIHLHFYQELQEILFIPHHLFLGAVKSFPAKIEVDSVEPDTISIIIVL